MEKGKTNRYLVEITYPYAHPNLEREHAEGPRRQEVLRGDKKRHRGQNQKGKGKRSVWKRHQIHHPYP